MCAKAFTKSTWPFGEYIIEAFIHSIVETSLLYLRQIRQDAYCAIVFNMVPVFLFKNQNHICIFQLKLWKINSEKIYMLSLIIFSGISLSWQAFLLSIEAVEQRCSVEKVLLEISQNSQENNCARVSFLIKLQACAFVSRLSRSPLKSYFLFQKQTRTLDLYRSWNVKFFLYLDDILTF